MTFIFEAVFSLYEKNKAIHFPQACKTTFSSLQKSKFLNLINLFILRTESYFFKVILLPVI